MRRHVAQVDRATRDCKGFAMCCSGSLAGNIPLENLEAYFDARTQIGYTDSDWQAQVVP